MNNTEDKDICRCVAERLGLPVKGVEAVAALLGDGATVPFISRYRKERTGSLSEVEVRNIETELKSVRELFARREFVTATITEAGKMTDFIDRSLRSATTLSEIEDIYAPFKPRKRTRATIAREKGLEPLAKMIMSGRPTDCKTAAARFVGKDGATDGADAIGGASDIIAEWASESVRLRNMVRNTYRRKGSLACSPVKGKEEELAVSPFAQYGDFSRMVGRMPSHQYLALRRAETEGLLKVRYRIDDNTGNLDDSLSEAFMPRQASADCRKIVAAAVADASKRLLRPSVENEVSASLKEEADRVAIDIFSQNLRQLLLASPLRERRILAIDPGYRTGCKTVALDEQGNLLDEGVIYPTQPKCDTSGALATVRRLIDRHRLDAIALGNGTASRETERFLKENSVMDPQSIFIVSEDGASVYSASDIARKEFPDKDVTVRGAVSIGRRLIDPLAELVKIDPKSIGVGQYQHDVDQSKLKEALDFTVMSCVNAVGVNVNTASASLLAYVSGIGPSLAAKIVEYRAENGPFRSRKELKKVPRLGDKAFEQAAGFLRVDGKEPLDNTGIHPESYGLVDMIARSLGVPVGELPGNGMLLDTVDIHAIATESGAGMETLKDIVAELRKPGRDPRTVDDNTPFIPGVENFDELREGMTIPGKVCNITAFGAFVDLGIKENGLLHISKLSDRRVASVSDVLRIGQEISVRVIGIDTARRRISLELITV